MIGKKQELPELNVDLLQECINFAKSNDPEF